MFEEAALTVKSPTCTVITVELVTVGLPPEPVRVTAWIPPTVDVRLQVAVAVPPAGTLAVVQPDTVTPDGLDVPVKVTAPVNERILVTVIVVEPVAPLLKLLPVADREKPGGCPNVKIAFAG